MTVRVDENVNGAVHCHAQAQTAAVAAGLRSVINMTKGGTALWQHKA